MAKVGIAVDDWKQAIFERHFSQAGYAFEVGAGVTADTRMFYVRTENPEALLEVTRAANAEAARTKGVV